MAINNTQLPSLTIITSPQMRDNALRFIRNAIITNGINANPNTALTSDWGILAQAFANETSVPLNNCVIACDQLMPDTTSGIYLDRWLNIYGIPRRPASSSIGSVVCISTTSFFIASGSQLVGPQGAIYQVLTSGVYGSSVNNGLITVQSVSVGASTNLTTGVSLSWVSSPPYFQSTVLVSALDPLTGGNDLETDAAAQNRLLAYLAAPPGAGNSTQLNELVTDSSFEVQGGFCYNAARGPSTVDLVGIGYASTGSTNRELNNTLLTNTVSPYALGNLFLGVDGYVANVQDQPLDLCINLSLPSSTSAFPAGPGGGWLDGAPLQNTTAKPGIRVIDGYALSGYNAALVNYQNTSTSFWIDVPDVGQMITGQIYNISYMSPQTLTLYQAQTNGVYVQAFGPIAAQTSLFYITVNTPFYFNSNVNTVIQPGNLIFPTASNTTLYMNTVLNYMNNMGPGERTNSPGLLPEALRYPFETVSFPYKLNSRLLKALTNADNAIYEATFALRGFIGPLNSGNTLAPYGSVANFQDYGTLSNNSDPCYAVYAPPTTYPYFGTMQAPAFVFTFNNIGTYPE
jgi:hypothetical protein